MERNINRIFEYDLEKLPKKKMVYHKFKHIY